MRVRGGMLMRKGAMREEEERATGSRKWWLRRGGRVNRYGVTVNSFFPQPQQPDQAVLGISLGGCLGLGVIWAALC